MNPLATIRRWADDERTPVAVVYAIVVLPFVFMIFFGELMWQPPTYLLGKRLLSENNVVEQATFAGCMIGSALAVWAAFAARRRRDRTAFILFAVLAVVLFGLGGEEVSWGEWLFHFEPPAEIKAINMQHELNVHNLPGIQETTDWITMGISMLGLAFALRSRGRFRMPRLLAPAFFVMSVTSGYDQLTYFVFINPRLDEISGWLGEVVEMLFAMSMAVYVWFVARRLAREAK